MTNGFSHLYTLDESIFSSRGMRSNFSNLFHFFYTLCCGVDIGMLHFNSLLYADDVILLSTTETGLQRCISKLEKYCDDWCLEVNLVK